MLIKKESNEKNKREIRRYAMGWGKKKAFKLFEAEKIHSEREEEEAGTERRSKDEAWESAQQESWLEEEELALI